MPYIPIAKAKGFTAGFGKETLKLKFLLNITHLSTHLRGIKAV